MAHQLLCRICFCFILFFVFDSITLQRALEGYRPPVLNLTLVSYLLLRPVFLTAKPMLAPAMDMAEEYLEKQYGFNLNHVYLGHPNASTPTELADNLDIVSNFYYNHWRENAADQLLVFVSPGAERLQDFGALVREWNVLMLATANNVREDGIKLFYPTTISNTPFESETMTRAILAILDYFSWYSVSVVCDKAALSPIYCYAVKLMENTPDLSAPVQQQTPRQLFFYSKNLSAEGCEGTLNETRQLSRVIILAMHPVMVRRCLITASSFGMTHGDYVFFATIPLQNKRIFGNLTWQNFDSDDSIALHAFRSLFTVSPCFNNEKQANMSQLLEDLAHRSFIDYSFKYPRQEKPNEYVITYYDSIRILGMVLNETLYAEPDILCDGKELASRFRNKTFQLGIHDVFIDAQGQGRINYCFADLDPTTGKFERVLIYDAHLQVLQNDPSGRTIDWANAQNSPPLNEPECGYRGDKSQCQQSRAWIFYSMVIVSTILATGTIAAIVGVIYKSKRNATWWIINETALVSASQLNNLDHFKQCQSYHGRYHEYDVWIKVMDSVNGNLLLRSNREHRNVLAELRHITHSNINRFIGMIVRPSTVIVVTDYCQKNHIRCLFEQLSCDTDFRISFITDILEGLCCIHSSRIQFHGKFSSAKCLVDRHFTVKIADLGFLDLFEQTGSKVTKAYARLRTRQLQQDDVLKFGTTVTEIINNFTSSHTGKAASESLLFASISPDNKNRYNVNLMTRCFDPDPIIRPSMKELQTHFKSRNMKNQGGVASKVFQRIQRYAEALEHAVAERTDALVSERKICDSLLREMLPATIVERLRNGEEVKAEYFTGATVYFSSIFGFVKFLGTHSPTEIAELLNVAYTLMDLVLPTFDVHKMETIGETYMVVSGAPVLKAQSHAHQICAMALKILAAFKERFNYSHNLSDDDGLQIRIGINSGPCAGGIVGFTRPRFCLFGDTINTASRMESHGEPSRIHVSQATVAITDKLPNLIFVERGQIEIKGKGSCLTYWLQ